MSTPTGREELFDLLAALCNGTITPREHRRLEELLAADPAARQFYFDYLDLHLHLFRWQRTQAMPVEVDGGEWAVDSECEISDPASPTSNLSPFVLNLSPPFEPLPSHIGGFLFSYLAATVVLGIGLLLGAMVQVSREGTQTAAVEGRHESIRQSASAVGQITGMLDCRWANSERDVFERARVPLGRKYVLASGLMEITYDSGAKVILQGPCSYEVESTRGGFLSRGRLTALVEKKGSGARGERTASPTPSDLEAEPTASLAPRSSSGKSEIRNPKSEISNPQSLIPNPLFFVRTPTAVVTDLGTEFGVEVGENGNTTSHVFRGSVKVQAIGDNGRLPDVVLRENQSARVEKIAGLGDARLVSCKADPQGFVRRLDKTPKELDVLDIVAGGNGMGHLRDRGIDPTTGMEDPLCFVGERRGDRRYRRVAWHKLIDGVFMPDGRSGAVQLDSAGHAFDQFPPTSGSIWGSIWPLAADAQPSRYRQGWIYEIEDRRRFTPRGRGLLGFSPNVGMTFDLDAMRQTCPSVRPARFRAIAGLGDRPNFSPSATSLVDLWVFVDGQLKLKRLGLCRRDGTVRVDVELTPTDRFLTLVATDGGDGLAGDWLVLGDPVLQLVPAASEKADGNNGT
jgi:hypothetical protein